MYGGITVQDAAAREYRHKAEVFPGLQRYPHAETKVLPKTGSEEHHRVLHSRPGYIGIGMSNSIHFSNPLRMYPVLHTTGDMDCT